MKLIYGSFIIITILLVASCKKSTDGMIPANTNAALAIDSAASYKIIITGIWKMPQHTVPAGNHFTKFNGLIHNNTCKLFSLGSLASLGVENVAEVGNNIALVSEMDNDINAGNASGKFFISLPNITGSDSAIVNVSLKHSLVSFESMIAPSPDWFAGLNSYNLVQTGKWVNDITVDIYGYDAGTEDGDVFGYNNPATYPQQYISYLTPANASVIANGNSSIAPFATVRFIKQ